MERIGFIGLGVMGQPMALNLLKAGHGLTVFARAPKAAALWTRRGACTRPCPPLPWRTSS